MKKFLLLTMVFSAVTATSIYAQGSSQATMAQPENESAKTKPVSATPAAPGGDQAAMLQQVKERVKPQMIEKTGLTAAQADRVIEINFEMRMTAARELRDLNGADRSAKMAELRAAKEKKISEIPLSAEQIKSVNNFYEEMGKGMTQKSGS